MVTVPDAGIVIVEDDEIERLPLHPLFVPLNEAPVVSYTTSPLRFAKITVNCSPAK